MSIKNKKTKIILGLTIAAVAVFFAYSAFAAEINIKFNVDFPKVPAPVPGGYLDLNCIQGQNTNLCRSDYQYVPSFKTLVLFIFYAAIWIAGLIAFGVLLYAGFLYIFGGSAQGNRSKAKEMFTNVIWGLAILLLSVVTLRLINPDITNLGEPFFTEIDPGEFDNDTEDEDVYVPISAEDPLPSARCLGGSARLVDDTTINNLADTMCSQDKLLKKDAHGYLIQTVGDRNCSDEDVDALLTKTQEICPTQTAGYSDIGITAGVIPISLCYWFGSASPGSLELGATGALYEITTYINEEYFGTADMNINNATTPDQYDYDTFRSNFTAILDYCADSGNVPFCGLLDENKSNITMDLNAEQKEALFCVCTKTILPQQWDSVFPDCR